MELTLGDILDRARAMAYPVKHERVVVLYDYKGGICTAAFVDRAAVIRHFATNPGTVIAIKHVTLTEGEGAAGQVY